ncbi:MAG: VWA domain-containing protein [Lentisphaeria bacterium]|nr:VWA domain-containing protein [Lentisphaeria bacterium]
MNTEKKKVFARFAIYVLFWSLIVLIACLFMPPGSGGGSGGGSGTGAGTGVGSGKGSGSGSGSGSGKGDRRGAGTRNDAAAQTPAAGKSGQKDAQGAAKAPAPRKPQASPQGVPGKDQGQKAPRRSPIRIDQRNNSDALPNAALLPPGTTAAAGRSDDESGSGSGGGGGFFGVRVKGADRIIFLLDVSGSMFARDPGCRKSRHELMRDEMVKCLKEGYADAFRENGDGVFLIVCFSSGCVFYPVSTNVVHFSSQTQVQNAITFVRNFRLGGGTDMLQAWQKIMPLIDRSEIRTVCFLSDGEPTDCSEADLLNYLKQTKPGLKIHTFSMGKDSGLLQNVAKQHGGIYRKIN